MWWLIAVWVVLVVGLSYWRRYWLAGYVLVSGVIWLGWRTITVVDGQVWLWHRRLILLIVAGCVCWVVAYLFWHFARRLLRRKGEHMAYRGLQTVAILLLVLPVITWWVHGTLVQLLWLSIGYFAVGLLAYICGTALLLTTPGDQPHQYLVILGSGIRADGTLTATLMRRVRLAARRYHSGGYQAVVVSGGQGPDEPITEAQAMAQTLITLQVPSAAIILESRSTSTLENLQFTLATLPPTSHITVITNEFHLLRVAAYAQQLGQRFNYLGATTPLSYLPLGALRDYLALLVMMRWPQLIGWLALMVVSILRMH